MCVQWTILEVLDVRRKTLSRGSEGGMAYANFNAHKFTYLNVTSIALDYVLKDRVCGLARVNTPSCFSFNLAAISDINNVENVCIVNCYHPTCTTTPKNSTTTSYFIIIVFR